MVDKNAKIFILLGIGILISVALIKAKEPTPPEEKLQINGVGVGT